MGGPAGPPIFLFFAMESSDKARHVIEGSKTLTDRPARTTARNFGRAALCLCAVAGAAVPPNSPAMARDALAIEIPMLGGWRTEVTLNTGGNANAGNATAATASQGRAAASKQRPANGGNASITGPKHALKGIASYYWQDQMTASGEVFNKDALTAAHPTLPFGTQVRVTRLDTGQSVVVRINDRGPFKAGRVIDLSKRAAEDITMTGRGLVNVKIDVVRPR